jgi:hypothetical protein
VCPRRRLLLRPALGHLTTGSCADPAQPAAIGVRLTLPRGSAPPVRRPPPPPGTTPSTSPSLRPSTPPPSFAPLPLGTGGAVGAGAPLGAGEAGTEGAGAVGAGAGAEPVLDTSFPTGTAALGAGTATDLQGGIFPSYPGLGMPPMDAPFSAAAFLRGQSPPPVTVATADSALAAALAAARTEAAAA